MALAVVTIGGLIMLIALIGIAVPERLIGLIQTMLITQVGLYFASGLRLLMGIVFLAAAPECRFTLALQALGILIIIAALAIPFIGLQQVKSMLKWWAARPKIFVRLWALVALAFGGFLVSAGLPV